MTNMTNKFFKKLDDKNSSLYYFSRLFYYVLSVLIFVALLLESPSERGWGFDLPHAYEQYYRNILIFLSIPYTLCAFYYFIESVGQVVILLFDLFYILRKTNFRKYFTLATIKQEFEDLSWFIYDFRKFNQDRWVYEMLAIIVISGPTAWYSLAFTLPYSAITKKFAIFIGVDYHSIEKILLVVFVLSFLTFVVTIYLFVAAWWDRDCSMFEPPERNRWRKNTRKIRQQREQPPQQKPR